ncbi:hypothetical protein ASE03_12690 [Kitasatospora sp. Root187]|nr:hypothetical protein ASC99_20490 [Kitasatospora sp. Root107]KRB60460.1 hypothetical protein ASE03_12690 [Kitasatospora sp. Root187]
MLVAVVEDGGASWARVGEQAGPVQARLVASRPVVELVLSGQRAVAMLSALVKVFEPAVEGAQVVSVDGHVIRLCR